METTMDADSSMISDFSDISAILGDGNPLLTNNTNLASFFKDCANHC